MSKTKKMGKRRHRSKPKVGQTVKLRWLDSGLGETEAPEDVIPTLNISTLCGIVLYWGPCEKIQGDLPAGMYPTVVVVATDSAGPKDPGSHVHHVWWPCVVEWKAYDD